MQIKAGPCPEASVQEFVKEVTVQLWRSNALMVVNAVVVIIMVAVGAAGRSYRHAAVTRFLFLGASSLYLPIVSYVASSIGKESCSTSGLHVFCHGRSYVALLLIWTVLVQIIGTNTTAIIVAADDYHGGGQQQKLGPSIQLLARTAWTSYLVFYYAGRGFLTTISKHYKMDHIVFYKKVSRYVIVLCLLSLAKIMLRLYAFWKARKSYALGRNPCLIAGYMEKLQGDHSDRRPQGSAAGNDDAPSIPPLIVMGEDKQKIEETPHGYSIEEGNSSLVTIDMVWRRMDDVLLASHTWLKDLCLSFALFKLLTRRFAKTHLAECGSARAFSFVVDVLLKNGSSADRVFSVIADEVSFVHDSYYSSMPTSHFGRLLPVLNIALSLSIIAWCLAGAALIVSHRYSDFRHQIYCSPGPAASCTFPHPHRHHGQGRIAFGNILFNILPTITLFGAVVIAEPWEIVSYLCSNWVKMTMLCNYMTHESWQQSPCVQTLLGFLMKLRRIKYYRRRSWSDRMAQRSLLLGAHEQQPMPPFFCLSHSYPKMQHAKVPPQLSAAIVDTLRSSNGTLSKGTAVLHKSGTGSHLLWACEGRGTSDVILTWHIATGILELEPRHHGGAAASSTSSSSGRSSADDKRAVATHLSRYCAYLVADVPQLLPDDKAWSRKLYKTLSRDIRRALAGDAAAEHDGIVVAARLAERSEHQVVKAGVRLCRQLMELIPDEEARWALLESFWCEILLYAAPSDNLKAHKKVIAHGTELLTLIWALLTHAGIVTRPK